MSEVVQGIELVGDDAVNFVPTAETPCPCCGNTGEPVKVVRQVAGRRLNPELDVADMTLEQLTREIINSSSCYCKAKARGAEELMAVAKVRMDAAKAAKALLTADADIVKEAMKAKAADEKAATKLAAKVAKDEAAAAKKAEAETKKAEAKAVKDAAIEAAKATMAQASTEVVIEEVGGL